RAVLLDFAALNLLYRGFIAEADAARIAADLDDFEVVFFAGFQGASTLERAGGCACNGTFVAPTAIGDFRVMAKAFDVVAEVHECAEHGDARSEEHTSELQSPCNLVCR